MTARLAGTCLLCGHDDEPADSVRVQLALYREPLPSGAYQPIPRCVDHERCRRRVVANGEAWQLVEHWRDVGTPSVSSMQASLETIVAITAPLEAEPPAEPAEEATDAWF